VKLIRRFDSPKFNLKIGILVALVFAGHVCARAQTPVQTPTPAATEQVTSEAQDQPQPATTENNSAAAAETEAAQKRLARARSLAAIGRLAAAASELETLRAASKDESVRDVSRVLLMAIFVEMPDYTRAAALLDEAYRAHTPGHTDDEATHSYFALAGQTVNSVRTHLERYRTFGVNVSDASELPAEANGDVEQLRGLLEKVVEQAKALHEEQSKGGTKGLDAAALLEDAATVRMRIARHDEDRARWQSEVSDARQHLFSSEMRIASISNIPATRAATPATQPPTNAAPQASTADKTAQPKPEQKTPAAEQQKSSKKSARPSGEQKQKTTTASSSTQQTTAPAQPPAAAQKPSGTDGAEKKQSGSPVAVGSLVAKAKSRVSPSYPLLARTAHVSGVVTVFIVVNEKGEVESVERAEGPTQLQQAATDAARRWKFAPTVIDGQRVRVTGYLSFNFSL